MAEGFERARLEQRGKGQSFVGRALKYQVDSQIFRAQFNAARRAAGDDRELHAAFTQHFHAVTVEAVERLDFLAAVGQIQRAVGEDAVDVENRESHALGFGIDRLHVLKYESAVFRGSAVRPRFRRGGA